MTNLTATSRPVRTNLDSNLDLQELNRRFSHTHPLHIISWCLQNFPTGLVQASVFNVDDMAIADMLYRYLDPNPKTRVLFVNTFYHFPETLEFISRVRDAYDIDLRTYQMATVANCKAFEQYYGQQLWEKDAEQFANLTRREPLQRGLEELGALAYLTGRRRDQMREHQQIDILELDSVGRLKVNPLAHWRGRDTWAYIYEHEVMYHPLHDRGYHIISDRPTADSIPKPVEDESLKRWRGSHKTECGIRS
ncbi:phosphoadenylyl-sulfate reductase [Roseofilum casamattae]|uniref:Phosphoadenylyl-sulfate reductase n=1 Tax=Roseofilum casamattae BLCC-M143 TaxID=3022442 RepID=A0ABT7BW49_9CYAN|nr:phosphoadenylyl-sulfate reductase [Roseofilum casamattae]MDJ1183418.1 phosphoadenylyl-sulfate reductase [Roseofilum casamattae BLCC-M143]